MKKNSLYTIGSLIILLICAFVFVLLPAFTGSGEQRDRLPAFGKYNGREIRYEQGTDFATYVSNYGQQFQNYGQQIDSSAYYYIFSAAFKSTVMKYAFTDYVNASGYKVPKSELNRKMMDYFRDETGNYSSKLYKQASDAQKIEIRNNTESSLISSRFYADNFGSPSEIVGTDSLYGLKEADAELDFLDSFGNEKRGFNLASFSLSDYPLEEKIKFAQENITKFISHDLLAITVDNKSKASTVAKRLAANEISFEDAVSEYSDKTYSDTEGNLTYEYQYQIEDILVNKDDFAALDALAVGELSDVIETERGFTIFKKNAESEQPDYNNTDVINAISSYLNSYDLTRIEDYYTSIAKDFSAAALSTSFEDACKKYGITATVVPAFPINYGSVAVTTSVDTSLKGLANADQNENFLKTAFKLEKNEISSPMVMNNSVVVIQYTNREVDSDGLTSAITQITDFDENASENEIMNSKKLVNNFTEVYFKNLLN